jgi:ATP-dependent DNA ligase
MTLRDKLPIGFIVPAQPVEREVPPAGADWVHEIKHDGYRMIKAKSFTIEQRAIRSCTPAPTPKVRAKAIQSPASP